MMAFKDGSKRFKMLCFFSKSLKIANLINLTLAAIKYG
jgi:hypothetical protein|tara:strand:- start:1277 stop:1390 length:114 start_codon:yes stop_codon:yes gene_type:complete